jgi:hypothetical protein
MFSERDQGDRKMMAIRENILVSQDIIDHTSTPTLKKTSEPTRILISWKVVQDQQLMRLAKMYEMFIVSYKGSQYIVLNPTKVH